MTAFPYSEWLWGWWCYYKERKEENKFGTVTNTWWQCGTKTFFLEYGAWRLLDFGDRGRLWARGHAFDDLADFVGVGEPHGWQLGVYDGVIHCHLERCPSTDFAGHNRMRDLPEIDKVSAYCGMICSEIKVS